jgi:hypothetical protein
MAKRPEKREDSRTFSFRMPGDAYDDLAAVARSRGVDISGVLNWIIAGARPALMAEQAAHEKAMQEAAAAREWERMGSAEALRALRELLGRLQDEYAALSKRVLGKGERLAG